MLFVPKGYGANTAGFARQLKRTDDYINISTLLSGLQPGYNFVMLDSCEQGGGTYHTETQSNGRVHELEIKKPSSDEWHMAFGQPNCTFAWDGFSGQNSPSLPPYGDTYWLQWRMTFWGHLGEGMSIWQAQYATYWDLYWVTTEAIWPNDNAQGYPRMWMWGDSWNTTLLPQLLVP
jgi:hypothetical protein